MKLGSALPFDIFKEDMSDFSKRICESFGGREELLRTLSKEINTIELRSVSGDASPQDVYRAASLCKEFGLEVTIHGKLTGANAGEFFSPYINLFESGFQSMYNITLHPLSFKEETEKALREICSYAEKMNYPVFITLENQRLKNEYSVNGICESVSEIVENVNSQILKACFDFGHQLSNIRKYGEEADVIDDKFLSLVRHTHIHSLYEGTTHFPLSCGEALLEKNLTELVKREYDGVLSLELEANRYADKFDIKDSFLQSVSVLKTALHQVQSKIKTNYEYEKNYDKYLCYIENSFQKSRCGVGNLGPAAYAVKMGNTKIAVDVSITRFPDDEGKRKKLIDFISGFDGIIITHSHFDHYDRQLIEALPKSVKLLIPDFIPYESENRISVSPESEISLGDVKIKFFESLHSRDTNIVPEYGFAINYQGENYIFPTDVRTYDSEKYPVFCNVKAVITHLWLLEGLNLYDNRYIDEFCDFANSFGAEKIYVSHLFDTRRNIESMWTDIHFDAVREKLGSPGMLKMGVWTEFCE